MQEAKKMLPRLLVVSVRSFAAFAAVAFFCSFTDWSVLAPWSLPPVAAAIVVAGAIVAAGLGALIVSLHGNMLRMLQQRPDVAAPIVRWTILAMMLLAAMPVARFGYPAYWLLAVAMTVTGLIALVALERYRRRTSASA